MCFFLLVASVDAREVEGRLELTWDGQWELDEMSGRGVATLGNEDELTIHLWIHCGDEMTLRAVSA